MVRTVAVLDQERKGEVRFIFNSSGLFLTAGSDTWTRPGTGVTSGLKTRSGRSRA